MAYLDASSRPTAIVTTMAAARAIANVAELASGQSLFVASLTRVWYWTPGDVTVDDGTDNTPAIEPVGGTGRFLPQQVIALGSGTIPASGNIRGDMLVVGATTSYSVEVATNPMIVATSGGNIGLTGAADITITSTANDVVLDAATEVLLNSGTTIQLTSGTPAVTLLFDSGFIYPENTIGAAGQDISFAAGDSSGAGVFAAGSLTLSGGYGNGALHTGGSVAINSGTGVVADGSVSIDALTGNITLDAADVFVTGTNTIQLVSGSAPAVTFLVDGGFFYPESVAGADGTDIEFSAGDTTGANTVTAGSLTLRAGNGAGALHTGGTVQIAGGSGTVVGGDVDIDGENVSIDGASSITIATGVAGTLTITSDGAASIVSAGLSLSALGNGEFISSADLTFAGDNIVLLAENSFTAISVGTTGAAAKLGFYSTAPIVLQTGVAVTDAGIHAALVNLGLITA